MTHDDTNIVPKSSKYREFKQNLETVRSNELMNGYYIVMHKTVDRWVSRVIVFNRSYILKSGFPNIPIFFTENQ